MAETEGKKKTSRTKTCYSILCTNKRDCFIVIVDSIIALACCSLIIAVQSVALDRLTVHCSNNHLIRDGCVCELEIVKIGDNKVCTDDQKKFCSDGELDLEDGKCIEVQEECQAHSTYNQKEKRCKCYEEYIEDNGECKSCMEMYNKIPVKGPGKCGECIPGFIEDSDSDHCVKIPEEPKTTTTEGNTKKNSTTIIILAVVCSCVLVGLIGAIVFALRRSSDGSNNPWTTHILTQDQENIQNCYVDPAEAIITKM